MSAGGLVVRSESSAGGGQTTSPSPRSHSDAPALVVRSPTARPSFLNNEASSATGSLSEEGTQA
eukprot:CAMPEP_0198581904 /NCGR_PEP_ID=MMETSP1462-20131121/124850_1 /TAXON_ID=1333877 /ORGANISM="Brandtodinium nutriculum, Strain RCC3387" /LENGTH=63 /DNA_ID=CAMNT_0044313293 /DNA_START=28 /DNA_END=216 /DNA_ORIENTATION=-